MKLKHTLIPLIVAGIPYTAVASPWPTATSDNVATPVNQSISIPVLANDVGDGLVLTKVNDWSVNGGRASINDDGTSVTYVPKADYQGRDTFWYNFKDDQGRTNAAKVSVRIEGDTSEQPEEWPAAEQDFLQVKVHPNQTFIPIDVLSNDQGVGLSLVSINEWSAKGNVARLSDDKTKVLFKVQRPISSWPILDELWYVFEDNWGRTNAGKLKVLLSTEDKPAEWPAAKLDSTQTTKNTNIKIDVLANDTGLGLALKDVNDTSLRWGKITVVEGKISYTPYQDFEGEDEFWYVFEDAWGRTNSAKVTIDVSGDVATIAQVPLNDTGITTCSDYAFDNSNNYQNDLQDCEATADAEGDPIPPGQDAISGRDATNNDDSDGHAGFSYTKLDTQGNALPASASSWSCVKDNVSGLIWETKKNFGGGIASAGLHTAEDLFTWYSTDPNKNGGVGPGVEQQSSHPSFCSGYDAARPETFCNTEAFVKRVNTAGLCGLNNWSMPTVPEILSLLYVNTTDIMTDRTYFPNTTTGTYSTETLSARLPAGYNMAIASYDGHVHTQPKGKALAVRLVSRPAVLQTVTQE